MRRRRRPLRYPVDVAAPHGFVGTPGVWHVRADAVDPLRTACGRHLRDGLTLRGPEPGDAVCRTCAARALAQTRARA